ncbi:MAG TPA: tyrosine-type recombinase/integrase [Candidatus Limnocylindria bacterium]|nr:tyrosine-type recombinase/integrase [Candidatus Limnocylindria bacterium]
MRNKNTPLDSVIESYLLYCHDKAERTREFYANNLGHFVRWLRTNDYDVVLADVDPNVVNQYLAERRRVSPYVARAACMTLKAFASWLARVSIRHDRGRSVLAEVRAPKVPQDVRRPLSDSDVDVVIETAKQSRNPERDLALLMLALDSGLRLGELCGLRVSDIDLRQLVVVVRAETSKGNRTREVRFGAATAKALDRYLRDFREESPHLVNGTDRLFLGLAGLPMTTRGLGQVFARIRRRSGVRGFMAHVCRHTWATNFRRRESGDLLDLKDQGGWRDDKMLQRYSHRLALSERRRGPSPMDALLRERRTGGVRSSRRESGALAVVSRSGEVA